MTDAKPPFIVNRDNAQHYRWGEDCDGWILLGRSDLNVIRERMPPGTCEARHHHEKARQFFLVLGGALSIEIEGVVHALQSGDGIEVPPTAKHQVRNDGETDAWFVVISSPTTRGDRIDETTP